jgi:putative membrane protein
MTDWGSGMHPLFWMWGAGGLVMLLMMLAFWGLVIAGAVIGLRALLDVGRRRSDPALEVLRERYARGELTRDEFQARRRELLDTPRQRGWP